MLWHGFQLDWCFWFFESTFFKLKEKNYNFLEYFGYHGWMDAWKMVLEGQITEHNQFPWSKLLCQGLFCFQNHLWLSPTGNHLFMPVSELNLGGWLDMALFSHLNNNPIDSSSPWSIEEASRKNEVLYESKNLLEEFIDVA